MNRTTSKEIQKQDHVAPETSRIPAEGAGPRADEQDKGHPPIDAAALTGDNGGGTSGNHGNGTAG